MHTQTIMKVVFDTNCFIDALNAASPAHGPVQMLLKAWDSGRLRIMVSLHTLHELSAKPDAALDLARTAECIPHYPVGTWGNQIAKWEQLAGTWNDARRNKAILRDLKQLAKARADIRDHGAYIDALFSKADAFVTSDPDYSGSGPAKRISMKYGSRILTPSQLAAELGD